MVDNLTKMRDPHWATCIEAPLLRWLHWNSIIMVAILRLAYWGCQMDVFSCVKAALLRLSNWDLVNILDPLGYHIWLLFDYFWGSLIEVFFLCCLTLLSHYYLGCLFEKACIIIHTFTVVSSRNNLNWWHFMHEFVLKWFLTIPEFIHQVVVVTFLNSGCSV